MSELLPVELEQDIELETSYELSGGILPSGTKTINVTDGGEITEDVTRFESVQVNVPYGTAVIPFNTIIASNPTITVENGVITATVNASRVIAPNVNEGWVVEGIGQRVKAQGSATMDIPSEYVIPSGSKTIDIDEAGTTTEDVTNYASVTVNLVAITDAEIDELFE